MCTEGRRPRSSRFGSRKSDTRGSEENFVAWVHHGLEELANHGLAARLNHNICRAERQSSTGSHIGGEGFTEWRDACGCAVAGFAFGDCLVHRFNDVRWRRQVDIAEVERINPISLGRPISGGEGDGECGLRAQVRNSLGDGHGCGSCFRAPQGQTANAFPHGGFLLSDGKEST